MITNKNFGEALEALKQGRRIARENWNGKNMFLYLNKGSVDIGRNSLEHIDVDTVEGISFELFEKGDDGTVTRLPNINMKNANGRTVTGWLASQTDLLANDWCILNLL